MSNPGPGQSAEKKTGAIAYEHIECDLRERIAAGEWPLGAMLPSQRTLAAHYGVGIGTVQRAVLNLLRAGILYAEDRRGTFVANIPAGQENIPPSDAPSPYFVTEATRLVRSSHTTPNPAARIGVIFNLDAPLVTDDLPPEPWVPTIIRAFERTVTEYGGCSYLYRVSTRDAGAYPTLADALQAAAADQVSALALVAMHNLDTWVPDLLHATPPMSIPLIGVSSVEIKSSFPNICFDPSSAGYLAARHLLDRGYEQIIVFRPFHAEWFEKRISGALTAIRYARCDEQTVVIHPPMRPELESEQYFKMSVGQRKDYLRQLLMDTALGRKREEIAGKYGIIAPNDRLASELLRVLTTMHLTPGPHVGVVSFDDDLWAAIDGLSSLHPPLEDTGKMAATLLYDALNGRPLPMKTMLSAQVITRASTQRNALT